MLTNLRKLSHLGSCLLTFQCGAAEFSTFGKIGTFCMFWNFCSEMQATTAFGKIFGGALEGLCYEPNNFCQPCAYGS